MSGREVDKKILTKSCRDMTEKFAPEFRGSATDQKRNKEELAKFCSKVVKKLAQKETKESGKPSTLKHVVRVDIGIMKKNGRNHYFVNEITRAVEMSLFSSMKRDIDFIKGIGHKAGDSIKELVEKHEV